MASIRTAGALLAAALLLLPGCAKRQPAPQAGPNASIGAAQQMRDTLTRANPTARVGIVYAVEPSSQLAGVRDTAVNDFQPGDSVQFLDARGNVIGDGTVVRQKNDAVHIQYNTGGTRAPVVGDLAVRAGGTPGGGQGGAAAMPDATGTVSGTSQAPARGSMTGDAGARTGGGASRLPPRRPTAPQPGDTDAAAAPAPAPQQPAPTGQPPANDATGAAPAPAPADGNDAGKAPAPAPDNTAAPKDKKAPEPDAGNATDKDKDAAGADDKPNLNK